MLFLHLRTRNINQEIMEMNTSRYTYPLNKEEKILIPLTKERETLNTLSIRRIMKYKKNDRLIR